MNPFSCKKERHACIPKKDIDEQEDKCLICGDFTGFYKNDFIQNRRYYVFGCGQLCKKCYCSIYPNGEGGELDAYI